MLATLKRTRTWTPIGIDIGEHAVRAVQLCRAGEGFRVANVAVVERTNREDQESQRLIPVLIRACLRQHEFHGREVVVGLNAPDVQFHTLELPDAAPDELHNIVRYEVERLITERADEVVTRHWSLPPSRATATNAIGVAAPLDRLTRMVDGCTEAGACCTRVEANATAVARLGALLKRWKKDEVWGVLDLSARASRLVLCIDEMPVLVRVAGPGGSAWTHRIAEALNVGETTAEVHKCTHGIALALRGTGEAAPPAEAGEIATMLMGVLRGPLHALAAEVKRSYEYVLSCYPDRHASDLVLVGGGAALHNLPEFLSNALGIAVHRSALYLGREDCRLSGTPRQRLALDALATAVGLVVPGDDL